MTLWPVTSATVKVESTSGLPNSVCAERWWSKCIGAVFWVSSVEPGVVGGGDGTSQRMLVYVADLEIFEEPPPPAFFDSHLAPRPPLPQDIFALSTSAKMPFLTLRQLCIYK